MSHSHCARMQMRNHRDGWPYSVANTSGCVERPCWRPDVFSPAVKAAGSISIANQFAVAAIDGQVTSFEFLSNFSRTQAARLTAVSPPVSGVLRI